MFFGIYFYYILTLWNSYTADHQPLHTTSKFILLVAAHLKFPKLKNSVLVLSFCTYSSVGKVSLGQPTLRIYLPF